MIGDVRNLLYFICPIQGNGVWEWNVDQLLKRIHLFNGRKVVAIVTGVTAQRRGVRSRPIECPKDVKRRFGDCGVEFIEMQNQARLGEVVAWDQLWAKVLPGGPDDVTFYGHAKGVSKPNLVTARRWAEILYESNLDNWTVVLESLKKYPIAGSLKKVGQAFQEMPESAFHYTGTFFWVRNKELEGKPWTNIRKGWAATEAWPGICFRPDEAGVIFYEGSSSILNMYEQDFVSRVIEPAYSDWKKNLIIAPKELPVPKNAEPGVSKMVYGRVLLMELIEAFGLQQVDGIQRIVIVADTRDASRVYIKKMLPDNRIPRIIGAIKTSVGRELEVDENDLSITLQEHELARGPTHGDLRDGSIRPSWGAEDASDGGLPPVPSIDGELVASSHGRRQQRVVGGVPKALQGVMRTEQMGIHRKPDEPWDGTSCEPGLVVPPCWGVGAEGGFGCGDL